MALTTGAVCSAKIGTDKIAKMINWSFTDTVEALDTTEFGDSYKTVIGGIGDWTGSCDGYLDAADTSGRNNWPN